MKKLISSILLVALAILLMIGIYELMSKIFSNPNISIYQVAWLAFAIVLLGVIFWLILTVHEKDKTSYEVYVVNDKDIKWTRDLKTGVYRIKRSESIAHGKKINVRAKSYDEALFKVQGKYPFATLL